MGEGYIYLLRVEVVLGSEEPQPYDVSFAYGFSDDDGSYRNTGEFVVRVNTDMGFDAAADLATDMMLSHLDQLREMLRPRQEGQGA